MSLNLLAKIKNRKINDVFCGSVLSYLLVILNAVYSIALTPYILSSIGDIEYGIYKTIASLSSTIMVLDLGIGNTITRYIARYRADKQNEKIPPFVSMMFVEGIVLSGIVMMLSVGILFGIPGLYQNSFSDTQIRLAQSLFLILSVNLLFHIIENILNGIIAGYNNYTYANALKLFRILFRIAFTYLLLAFYDSSIVLVSLDLALTVLLIIFEYLYIKGKYKLHIVSKIKKWDKTIFIESGKYTSLLFISNIASQVNGSLDNVVIGAELGAEFVTVYSIAITFFVMFEQLSMSISNVMLPTITETLVQDKTGKKTERTIISCGRIQFMLLGSVLAGFAVLGQDFINLWLGDGFVDAYYLTLMLFIPSILELIINVCISILRAQNRMGFRTIVLICSTVVNALITIIGVKYSGYYWAAIGTGISFLLGSVITMGVYYKKVIGLRILNIYKSIFSGTWISILISMLVTFMVHLKINSGWVSIIVNVVVFIISFVILQMLFGLNETEKNIIKNKFLRR